MRRTHVTRDQYLAAFVTWAGVMEDRDIQPHLSPFLDALQSDPNIQAMEGEHEISAFCAHAEKLEAHRPLWIVIPKSNLLARLLYGGEKLRTTPCPVHCGTWSGVPFPAAWFKADLSGNPYYCGCQGTGWLPEGVEPRPTVVFTERGCSNCGWKPPSTCWFPPPACPQCERQAITRRFVE